MGDRLLWKLKMINLDMNHSAISDVSEKLVNSIVYLESLGYKPFKKNEWNSEFIYRFSGDIHRYGGYYSYVFFNKHRIECIYCTFSGAESGIDGWDVESFNGNLQYVDDLKVILRLCYIDEKIKEFS